MESGTTDDTMTLRQWARSRAIPVSTASKAAKRGRITRGPTGRVDPILADREWTASMPLRVDARSATSPNVVPDAGIDLPSLVAEVERAAGPGGKRLVRVADALVVDSIRAALLEREHRATVERLAPALAAMTDADDVRDALHKALDEAVGRAETRWQRWVASYGSI